MHYYQHNIGDYARDTGHLSVIEHGVYRLLLDWCYLNEKPISTEQAMRVGRGNPEATQSVLSEFFVSCEYGWRHKRVDSEIAKYHQQAEKNRLNGLKGGRKKPSENPVGSESVATGGPNQEPRTKNQEPIKEKTPRKRVAPPDGVSDRVWEDFLDLRKVRKAPMTQAALDGIRREAEKAGWSLEDALRESCARGWQGFKADWVADKPKPATYAQQAADVARATVPAKQGPDPALQKIIEDRMKAVPPPADVREKLAALRGGS